MRRFALAVALVHLAFLPAGVSLDPKGNIAHFGIPLAVTTPELFGVVLIAATIYGGLRFYFYGCFLEGCPARERRRVKRFETATGNRTLYKSV